MIGTRGPARLMLVCQDTLARICRQVILKPGDLRTRRRYTDLRVQRIDAPAAKVICIERSNIIEVLKVARCARSEIVMVAGRGPGARFMSSPGGVVTVEIFRVTAIDISIVPGRKDCAWNII